MQESAVLARGYVARLLPGNLVCVDDEISIPVREDVLRAATLRNVVRGSIRVRGVKPGVAHLTVTTRTSANDPSATIWVSVSKRPEHWKPYTYVASAVLFVLAGGGAYVSLRRATRRALRSDTGESGR